MRRYGICVAGFVAVVVLLAPGCGPSERGSEEPGGVRIALYTGPGTDADCVTATRNMLRWLGYEVAEVGPDSVCDEGLSEFSMFCVPGGDMYQYTQDLGASGRAAVRTFIQNGGGYVGICGGAYLAGTTVVWLGQQIHTEFLRLFQGTAEGPVDEIVPYPQYGMCRVNVADHTHPITSAGPDSLWVLYYWGPVLTPGDGDSVSVLAKYADVRLPAVLAFEYGLGRVFLIGAHPEFEEDSDRDGVDFADDFDDRGSDWGLVSRAVLWCLGD